MFVSVDGQHNASGWEDASLVCEQNWVMGSMQQTTYVTDHEQLPKGQNLSFSNKSHLY